MKVCVSECVRNGTHGSTLHTTMHAYPEHTARITWWMVAWLTNNHVSGPTGNRQQDNEQCWAGQRDHHDCGSAARPIVFFCKSFITALLTVLPFRRRDFTHARNFEV